jgi:hypothetical protein
MNGDDEIKIWKAARRSIQSSAVREGTAPRTRADTLFF